MQTASVYRGCACLFEEKLLDRSNCKLSLPSSNFIKYALKSYSNIDGDPQLTYCGICLPVGTAKEISTNKRAYVELLAFIAG